MVSIALCSGNEQFLDQLKEVITTFLCDNNTAAKIMIFNNSNELLSQEREYDIYILDIDLTPKDGIKSGEIIKKKYPDAHLIYYADRPNKAFEAMLLQSDFYLLKPVSHEKLAPVFDTMRQKIKEECIFISTTFGEKRLMVNSIAYVDIVNRCICYHKKDKSLIYSQSLRQAFEKSAGDLVNHPKFIFLKPSLIINLCYIETLDKDNLTLSNGEKVYFPKCKYEIIEKQWKEIYA